MPSPVAPLLDEAFGSFKIILALNLVERHRNDVFVAGNAGGQDFGDDRIGNHREAEINSSGGGGVLEVIYFAESQNECKHAVLVVEENIPRLTTFHTTERQR